MSNLSTVRALLGDDNSASYTWSDEQIETMLGLFPSPGRAAYQLAVAKAAFYAGKPNRSIDGLSVNYGELSRRYTDLAQTILSVAGDMDMQGLGAVYAGGMTVAEKQADRANTGRTQPRFVSGQFSNNRDTYEGWNNR